MRIGVLGPLEIDDRTARLGARDRIVLAALAMNPGEMLSREQLADAVWGEQPPASWSKNVQGCISRLRKQLGPDAIETSPRGYRLTVSPEEVDTAVFSRSAHRARELLTLKESEHARYVATQALELWRGRPLDELDGWESAGAESSHLCELRAELEEIVVEASLAAGHHREVLGQAAAMVEAAPLRERRWALLARAQYQAGRQTEALQTIRRIRVVLQRELGLDPSADLVALEQAILLQDPALLIADAPQDPGESSPYPGLTPYGEAEAESFFGRDSEVRSCLERLGTTSFLAVVGASGSGKSSLLRAGLAAALRRDGTRHVVIAPGAHPMDALGAARVGRRHVILVDQAEEAFSVCRDERERDEFFAALVAHTEHGRVVMALRADHTGELAKVQSLAALVERGLFLLSAMSPEALRSAIESPARQRGLVLEPGLTDLLVREVEGQAGGLPLLSHALRETWLRREGRTLTVAGYQASGGIRGAVAHSAERLYGDLEEAQRSELRELVLRLVIPTPEGEPVRGRLPRHQVVADAAHEDLVDQLVAARLVTSDDGAIQLAHEAMVRAWPRLRAWIEDDLEGQRTRHRLMQATEDWALLGRQDSELYRGARLAAVREWVSSAQPQLTDLERRFLAASDDLATAEERSAAQLARTRGRMVRRLRFALAGAAALLALALVAGFLAVGQAHRADRSAVSAQADRVGAQSLVTSDITRSLLMAVAAVRLHPSPETERDLDADLARHPELIDSATVPASSNLSAAEVAPDGRTLAVADTSHHVWTYDARTLEPLADAQLGRDLPASYDTPVAFSATGDTLAVGAPPSAGSQIRLLDPRTLHPLPHQLNGWPHGSAQLVGFDYSRNGRYLAASINLLGSAAHSAPVTNPPPTAAMALIWNVAAPGLPLVRRIRLDSPIAYDPVGLSPNGRTLYTGWALAGYDVRTGARRFRSGRASTSLVVDPAGRLLAGTFGSGFDISLLDARTGHLLGSLRGHTGDIDQLAFSHDGASLAATSRDGRVIVWDVRTREVEHDFDVGAQFANGLAFSPDDSTLFTTAADSHELHMWDLSGRDSFLARDSISHPFSVNSAFIRTSPDASAVAATGINNDTGNRELRITDVLTGHTSAPLATRDPDGPWTGAGSWSSDDQRFAMGYRDGWVQVFSRGRRRPVLQRRTVGGFIMEVGYTPDRRGLGVLDNKGHVQLLDASTLRPSGPRVSLPPTLSYEMSMGPDNRQAFVIGAAPEYRVGWSAPVNRWWLVDLRSGRILEHGQLAIAGLYTAFSPRGDRVAVGGLGGVVELLDLTTGQPVRAPMVGHDGDVYWVSFNADGTRLASGSNASDVALWDGRTGQLLSSAKVPGEQRVTVAGFRPDGDLTVASFTGQAYRWDPRATHALAFACRAAGRDLTAQEWHTYVGALRRVDVCPS